MGYNSIQPSTTGLVLFDMLNYGVKGGSEADEQRLAPVVANCVRLRDVAHQTGMAVYYSKADHRPDGLDIGERYTDFAHGMKPWPDPENRRRLHTVNVAGSWGAEVIEELAPEARDYVIPKHRYSAFFQTHLELSMRSRRNDTMILCGGAIEIGIASTAYAARDLDIDIVFASDACTSAFPDIQQIFMDKVFRRLGRVRTTDEVLEMIRAGQEEEGAALAVNPEAQ